MCLHEDALRRARFVCVPERGGRRNSVGSSQPRPSGRDTVAAPLRRRPLPLSPLREGSGCAAWRVQYALRVTCVAPTCKPSVQVSRKSLLAAALSAFLDLRSSRCAPQHPLGAGLLHVSTGKSADRGAH